MSVVWGTTWIATKLAIDVVPPIFFGTVRFALVALLLLPFARGLRAALAAGAGGRLLASGLLINTGTYAPLFWGMQFIPTGVAALINLSMIAVGLYGLAILAGRERPSWRHGLALLLGLLGLATLFAGNASLAGPQQLAGAAATILGTFAFCIGTTLSRPLLDSVSPVTLTGLQAAIGAAGMAVVSLALEPVSAATLGALLQPRPLAGLLFMVIGGSLVAFTIYLRLVRDWGAPRAGLYAFTSPVIALVSGYLVFGEPLGLRQIAGAVLMLGAAAVALRGRTT